MWENTGRSRPKFARVPGDGQESVWDYPRPPRLAPDRRRIVVRAGGVIVVDTRGAIRVLETASPPTIYLPPTDVDLGLLVAAPGSSMCEWKGRAVYWSVRLADGREYPQVGWSYPQPTVAFAAIAGWLSFYPGRVECEIDGERVRPQPGSFYGGWVTNEIVGPFKGEPGTGHW